MEQEDQQVDVMVAQLLGTLGAHNSGDSTQDHFANYDFQGKTRTSCYETLAAWTQYFHRDS